MYNFLNIRPACLLVFLMSLLASAEQQLLLLESNQFSCDSVRRACAFQSPPQQQQQVVFTVIPSTLRSLAAGLAAYWASRNHTFNIFHSITSQQSQSNKEQCNRFRGGEEAPMCASESDLSGTNYAAVSPSVLPPPCCL